MTLFHLRSRIFPDNAISRAERLYQQRTAKRPRAWRRWLNRAIMWLAITMALIQYGGLLAASLTQRDPSLIRNVLAPFPELLIYFAIAYHFYLTFQTIVQTAHSITREKEAQTWEVLVLTGVDARQIVRGKWRATLQRQLPRYALLSILRAGMTAAVGISFISIYSYRSIYYQSRIQLPHPFTIVMVGVLGAALTLANLGFAAACGMMGSAASSRSTLAILRSFVNQIVLSLVPVVVILFLGSRILQPMYSSPGYQIVLTSALGVFGLVDNGFILLTDALNTNTYYGASTAYTPIAAIQIDWIVAGVVALALYAFFTLFALWRAEKRAVGAMATPVERAHSR